MEEFDLMKSKISSIEKNLDSKFWQALQLDNLAAVKKQFSIDEVKAAYGDFGQALSSDAAEVCNCCSLLLAQQAARKGTKGRA